MFYFSFTFLFRVLSSDRPSGVLVPFPLVADSFPFSLNSHPLSFLVFIVFLKIMVATLFFIIFLYFLHIMQLKYFFLDRRLLSTRSPQMVTSLRNILRVRPLKSNVNENNLFFRCFNFHALYILYTCVLNAARERFRYAFLLF